MIYLNLQPSIAEKFSVYELYLSDFQIQSCCPRRYLGSAGIVGHPSHKPFVLWVWENLFVLMLEKFLKIDGGNGFTGVEMVLSGVALLVLGETHHTSTLFKQQ